jgi:cell shape-determining protein MreD
MISLITTTLCVLGVYGILSRNFIFFIIGAISAIVEILIGMKTGQLKSPFTMIIASIFGIVYATSNGLSAIIGILMGLCFEAAVMGVLGWLMIIVAIIIEKKNKSY